MDGGIWGDQNESRVQGYSEVKNFLKELNYFSQFKTY